MRRRLIVACMSYSIDIVNIHDVDSNINICDEKPVLKINAEGKCELLKARIRYFFV